MLFYCSKRYDHIGNKRSNSFRDIYIFNREGRIDLIIIWRRFYMPLLAYVNSYRISVFSAFTIKFQINH